LNRDALLNSEQELAVNQEELRGEISIDIGIEIENSDGLNLEPLFDGEVEKGVFVSLEESGRRVFLDWLLLDRVGVEVNNE